MQKTDMNYAYACAVRFREAYFEWEKIIVVYCLTEQSRFFHDLL